MKYQHLPTTIDDQIMLLRSRGMVGDKELMRRWLVTVGYYRLSAYWLPLELPAPEGKTRSKQFLPGTDFSQVVDVYVFDRKLRLLMMEGIDRFEIAVRARWTNRFSVTHGSHAYMDSANFGNGFEHTQLYAKLVTTTNQSSEVFIDHYRKKYTEPFMPPLWQVTELMTLGELSKWVERTRDNNLKDEIARDLGLPNKETMEGVLQLLSYIRNICAHHGRLWNRRTVKRAPRVRQFLSDMQIESNKKQSQPENSIYNAIVVLAKTLRHQSPDTTFPQRIAGLVETRSPAQRRAMGFPDDWQMRPIWKAHNNSDREVVKFARWIRERFQR
ncbi:MAG: Abi family protein [Erythrobacter sp.]